LIGQNHLFAIIAKVYDALFLKNGSRDNFIFAPEHILRRRIVTFSVAAVGSIIGNNRF